MGKAEVGKVQEGKAEMGKAEVGSCREGLGGHGRCRKEGEQRFNNNLKPFQPFTSEFQMRLKYLLIPSTPPPKLYFKLSCL